MANEYKVSSLHVEVIHDQNPVSARVSAVSYEVLAQYPAQARVSSVAYEVLRTIASGVAPVVRRRTIVLGSN